MSCANEFTCAECGETFHRGRPIDEALAEAHKLFPEEMAANVPTVEICDDCWPRVLARVQRMRGRQ